MSQIGKKEKSLSTKSNVNKKKTNSVCSKESSSNFDSFFSLSLANKKENKDDSLLGSECHMKDISYQHNESDLFKFPSKSKATGKNDVVSETSFESKASESDNAFQEETKVDTSLELHLLGTKPNIFNDTTLTSSDHEESNKECIKSDSFEITIEKGNSELNNLDEEVPISRAKVCRNPPTVEDKKYVTNKDGSEVTNQCPICLKTVTKYLSHMKSCAAKNKLSTQQLLSALKLHKKQLAERKELGLGLPIQSYRAKVSPKRSRANDKKGPVDSSLQLALALSASLHSAEENELIQEAEALKEAGLSEEAEQKLSTLEKYGFATSLPPVARIAQGSSKSMVMAPTLLQKRTREDRERIVTEKVAIVLINEDENVSLDEFTTKELVIKSNQLRKVWDKDSQLWTKAHCGADEQRQAFYVQKLSEFVTPSKSEVGENLKRLSQLPGRLNTPERDCNFSPTTSLKSQRSDEVNLSELTTPPQISSSRETLLNLVEVPTTHKSWQNSTKTQKLSDDWLALVNNSKLSDITIQCSNNDLVPAHKLVFHVRCPSVLEAVVMVENREEFLDCNDSSKDSILAFLEFVYSGSTNRLSSLVAEDLHCVLNLADKFNCSDLMNHLRTFVENKLNKAEPKKDVKRDLFHTNKDSENSLNISSRLTPKRNSLLSNISSRNTSELNFASTSRIHNNDNASNSSNGRGSPDMFCESDLIECDVSSQESRDDLDILASLVGKSLTEVGTTPNNKMSESGSKTEVVLLLNSSPEVTLSKSLPVKRKAQSSCSEDEQLTPLKKVCSDLSQSALSENQDGIFDLTQSSNSSTEEHTVNGLDDKSDKDLALAENIENEDDCLNELTQKNPSPLNSSKDVDNCADFQNSRDSSRCYDYIDPVWDGFDDNYSHYNYEFNNSVKNSGKFSLENSPSADKTTFSPCSVQSDLKSISSPKNSSKYTYPNNKTPEKSCQTISCLSPRTSSTVKYISSESKSPKQYSQKTISPLSKASYDIKCVSSESKAPRQLLQSTLDKYSPQSSKNLLNDDSDVEIIENYHSPDLNSSNRNKTRKNLSSQFSLSQDNVTQTFHHTPKNQSSSSHDSPVNSPTSAFKQFSQNNKNKTPNLPVKRDSLAAMQRLLDDSLEISDSVFATADGLLASEVTASTKTKLGNMGPSTSTQFQCTEEDKGKKSLMTPSPGIVVSDDVTPLADYSAMKTPALKCSRKS
ncbi:uncharacterized protein LOC124357029 isoform X2 [Homalodisca vitripennis]|uniref:uncharacterized protein LOC124357029 isoform X2 n=1 Tax=Homalodisca vitripennis TaxID=197043 RepID=UPI001EEA4F04|nr:uncharacterized protein LOC124357029 isoform X2 [Homalodisca vitripennis]